MDEAFVKHTQHDIQRGQSRQHQHNLIARGIAEHFCRALKAAHHRRRHGKLRLDGSQGLLRLRKRHAGRKIERKGHCGKLPLMRHRKGRKSGDHCGDAEQRNKAVGARQAHLAKSIGPGQPVRPVFQHHMILVFILIDSRCLTLPKGIAKGGVHILHAQAVAGQGITIHLDQRFKAALFNIAVHVLEQGVGGHSPLQLAPP